MAGTNFNNLRHADDTTLMAESEEELKSLLMKVKEEREKAGFKVNMKKKQNKNQIRWTSSPSFHVRQKGKKWKQ